MKRKLFFQISAVSNDNSGNRIFEKLFKIAGTGFRIIIGDNLTGTYHVYGYLHGDANNAAGYGLSADQPLGRGVTLFGRWNKNDSELSDYFGITSAWSIGGQWLTRAWQRTFTFGAAFGETTPASKNFNDERLLEIYLRQHLNQWMHISPHLQWIKNAAGSSDQYLILGLRTQFDF